MVAMNVLLGAKKIVKRKAAKSLKVLFTLAKNADGSEKMPR